MTSERTYRHPEAGMLAEDFRAFVSAAWHVIEPATPFIPGFHLDAICEHLEAVSRGDIRNLLITIPPRMSKSSLVSVLWPAWEWTSKPERRYLTASYAAVLATRDAVKTRRLVASPWYQDRWGGVFRMAGDQNLKQRYENDKGGYRIATSVGGSATGDGGDAVICLRYNQHILTESGYLPIGRIVEQRLDVRVLGFDHKAGQVAWAPIEAYEQSPGRSMVRVTCSNGAVIDCTADHPVFIQGRGYVQAGELSPGDEVLTHEEAVRGVREGCRAEPGAHGAVAAGLLFAQMQRNMGNRREESVMARRPDNRFLHGVREGIASQAVTGAQVDSNVLLARMPNDRIHREPDEATIKSDDRLRLLWRRVPAKSLDNWFERPALLQPELREFGAFACDDGDEQSGLEAWKRSGGIRADVSSSRAESAGARQPRLPNLRDDSGRTREGTGGSPHRLRPDARCDGQPHQPLFRLPSESPWAFAKEARRMEGATIVAVGFAPDADQVYNLRIATHHNYFVGGVLLHNCDDPLSAMQAESDTFRETALEWWDVTMSTRLNNPKTGVRVVVQQRLHERDLAGHILLQGGYEHLNLPMEYEPNERATSIGWRDPRTEPGQLLAPERFGPAQVTEMKLRLGSRAYAGQMQQRPAPAEGDIIKRQWWRFWQRPGMNLPPVRMNQVDGKVIECAVIDRPAAWDRMAQSWDMTFRETKSGSYVVGQVWAASGSQRFLLDQTRARMGFSDACNAVERLTEAWPDATAKYVENKANGPAVIDKLREKIGGLIEVNPEGGKEARANAITPDLEAGNVFLPHPEFAPWVWDLIEEAAAFPNGANDDQVDTMSQALTKMRKKKSVGAFDLSGMERVNPLAGIG